MTYFSSMYQIERPNGLPISRRERAGKSFQKANDLARSGRLHPTITAGRDFPPEKPFCRSLPSTAIIPRRPAVEIVSPTGAFEPMLHPGSSAPATLSLVAAGSFELVDPDHHALHLRCEGWSSD